MTTVAKALKDCLDNNWNVVTGGTEPALYNSETTKTWPVDDDWVMVLGWTFREKERARNDSFKGVTQYIDMRVHSRNDADAEARLDELVTEIKRVVNATNVTGYHKVRVTDQTRIPSDRRTNSYVADLTVELIILSTSSTATPGSTTSSTAEFDELTVNISAAIAGLAATGDTSIDSEPTATGNQLGIIKLTPTNPLDAGAVWIGFDEQLAALDPATGAACSIIGYRVNAGGVASVDSDAIVYGLVVLGTIDNFYGVYVSEVAGAGAAGVEHNFFYGLHSEVMATTHTTRGVHIDFDGATRSANAPVLEGVKVELPADYSNFGANKAGYFSGDGRSVTLCDTTYAADVSGDYRLDGMTNAQLEDLLMFGSANAAWVNCPYEDAYTYDRIYSINGWLTNTGVNNPSLSFGVSLSCNRGGLKLYISGVRIGIGDADAEAYITNTVLYGFSGATRTTLDTDPTDHNSAGEKEDTFTAVDCSGQTAIKVVLNCIVDAANELDIGYVAVRAYYAA